MINKEKNYEELVDLLPEIVFELDSRGVFTYVNKKVIELLGYLPDVLVGKNVFDFLKEDEQERAKRGISKLFSGTKYFGENYNFRRKDGSWMPLILNASQIKLNGMVVGVRGIAIDRTDIYQAEKALEESEKKFRTMIEHSSEVIAVVDHRGYIKYESQSLKQVFGYSPDDISGIRVLQLIHPEDRRSAFSIIRDAFKNNKKFIILDFRVKHKDGSWHNVEAAVSDIHDNPAINGIVINIKDITDRKVAEEKANYYEFHDSLTDLPNREMLFKRIEIEIKKAKTYKKEGVRNDYIFAVMCLGLDKFKKINDMYGPATGDILLKKIGLKLKKCYRDDDLVSRYIGDSFMILFSGISKYEDVTEIIQKTNNVFSDPFIVGNNIFKVSCSIGVCLFPHDGQNKEQLVKNSESAMYIAKEDGRNTHRLYDADMNAEMLSRLKLETDLEYAIFHNHFISYYQPIYNREGKIIGMESLIRWHLMGGDTIIYPSSFIPLAEKNGMIIEIGNRILYQSCVQAKKWQEKGYPQMVLAVNISPSQFKQPRLIQDIKDVINQTGLDPHFLELEITESGIMENEKYNIGKLNEIHNLGVKISIDDFGTGYSSFSKLKDYPIDTLKIDKSFVENLPDNEKSSTITTAIIDLAHNLGFKVVAEGVETKEQLDFLYDHNCDEFQGYYFSVPLNPEEFDRKLKSIVTR